MESCTCRDYLAPELKRFHPIFWTIAILGKAVLYPRGLFFVLGVAGIVGAATLFLRYLKFYRLYSVRSVQRLFDKCEGSATLFRRPAAAGK